MQFKDLSLHPALAAAIEKQGFESLTAIQEACYEHIVDGKDIAGLSQTGTGKTAAFLIPLIQRLLLSKKPESSRLVEPGEGEEATESSEDPRIFKNLTPNQFILVLVPTRELADQVYSNVEIFGGEGGLKAAVVMGGASYETQKKLINDGVDFIVSTPGRLIDLYKENIVDLKQVRAVVFDEADRMFDMGFKDDMRYVLQRIPRERQYLCFSATLDFEVLNTAYEFGSEPLEVSISKDEPTADNVDDKIIHVGSDEKPQYLLSLLKKHNPRQAIVFTNFKNNIDRVATFLSKNGVKAKGISSLLSQKQRTRVMEDFKSAEKLQVMVATDVAARGLDIKGVDLVINFEVPDEASTYVHRIGRTGRAEASGIAFSLVSDRDIASLARVEKYLDKKLEAEWVEDEDLVSEFEPMPRDVRSQRLRGQMDRRRKETDKRKNSGGGRGGHRGGNKKYSKDRDRDRDRNRRPRDGEREGQRDETTGDKPVHRDRRSGRHGQNRGKGGDGEHRNKNNKKRRNNNRNRNRNANAKSAGGKKHRVRSSNSRRGGSSAQQPAGVGAKIKSFFKNLFD